MKKEKKIIMKSRRTSKKQVIYGLTFMLIVLSAVVLPSCMKSDGGDGNSQIVGTWTCTNHWYGGSDTYVFKSNGKYEWSRPNLDVEYGDYSFNGVILTTSSKTGATRVYTILSLTDSYFVMMDEDGDSYTYYK